MSNNTTHQTSIQTITLVVGKNMALKDLWTIVLISTPKEAIMDKRYGMLTFLHDKYI
jgi:hypothetical protein